MSTGKSQKNRHERQRRQPASRAENGARGQPLNLVKNFAVSSEFQARLLGHSSRKRGGGRKTRRNLRKRGGTIFFFGLFGEERARRSTCRRETISEFSSDSKVSGVPMPVRRDSKETRRIGGSYPLAASQPQTVDDRLLLLCCSSGYCVKRVPRIKNARRRACRKLCG